MNKNSNMVLRNSEKRVMRILIILGLISIANFFYWFLKDDLISNPLLYGMLLSLIIFDVFRLIYIWYHYWSISFPSKPKYVKNFSVDILTTFYPGEPEEMVINTLMAINRIKYPHTTYLCDEENNPKLKSFCNNNGIIHVTRNNRIDAKAGNINNALNIAKGEICLILDPDHVPNSNFLDEVLPYFENEKIGFVQTVQSYHNINASKVAQAAAEQTFQFYGPVMMSMNSYGTVNAIGANCVFRRKALDSINGHAAGLSEDMHTAMKLHAKSWESIYVPQALSAGLAPQTLSAYYKQQLKWSRGTFDLLFSVYPKLFKSLTLRQKLHYGILPFHYLAGVFFMISFLIPIIALLFSITPWKGNVVSFGLIALPVLGCLITIRLYSQRWLIRKEERGFHILGGLLLQCTWWVYISGVLYTLIGKKVPYLPTLKSDDKSTPFSLILPNILFGFVSIFAVVFGLIKDFTPFSIIMAAFAIWNASILLYTIKFAYGKAGTRSKIFTKSQNALFYSISKKSFELCNKLALPIVLITLIGSIGVLLNKEKIKQDGYAYKNEYQKINYIGIFAPEKDNGVTEFSNADNASDKLNQKFDILSFYIPWDKNIETNFNWNILDSVFSRKSIPLITWEPWLNTFENDLDSIPHVNDLILSGYLDDYLKEFALKLKNINKPIFLRYAHEFDNPFYPWYDNRENAASLFIKAWRHVNTIFKENRADNVIWIWNPWKSKNVVEFFPGNEYVDWLGVNILNYSVYGKEEYFQFSELYESFHYEFNKLSKMPVIISEMGTLSDSIYQNKWIDNAINSINNEFKEIEAIVYFNSNVDNNYPNEIENDINLNWSYSSSNTFKYVLKNDNVPDYVFKEIPSREVAIEKGNKVKNKLKNITGINLIKGENWNEDYHILSRENLISDFKKMKNIGVNTIKFEDNPTYNYNVINLSKSYDINLAFGFEIPLNVDFKLDTLSLRKIENRILKTVNKFRNQSHIVSWHFQNDVLSNLYIHFKKPEILYQKQSYLNWLDNLFKNIKKIDSRPIVLDVEINRYTIEHSEMILSSIKEDITIGLIGKQAEYVKEVDNYFKNRIDNYLYSSIDLKTIEKLNLVENEIPFYYKSWQDQNRLNFLSFDGLIDRKGRAKADYFNMKSLILGKNINQKSLKIKIIKPHRRIVEGYPENYYAMVFNEDEQWQFAEHTKDLIFEWFLIKKDNQGNFISAKKVGNNPVLELKIPSNYESYSLELSVTKAGITTNHITILNMPYNLN